MSTPRSARATQMIYTNVEADMSPHRQRGAQVWLCSPELTPEQRQSVARRVSDFRAPRGMPALRPGLRPGPTPVAEPAAPTEVRRHVYARTEDGLYVVAQSVPLAEKDKFDRGGRFHAHVLVFTEHEFAGLGYDPFAVIDGWGRFQRTPSEAGDWRAGTLDPVEIAAMVEPHGALALPPDRLVELAALLVGDGGKTVVVPAPPHRVLALLRGVFSALPFELRRRAFFDTLSPGDSLAKVWYPLAGGNSPDHVRLWQYRKYVLLDPEFWSWKPPVSSAAPELPLALLAAPGWAELTAEHKEVLYRTGQGLIAGDLDALRQLRLPAPARVVWDACPSTPRAVDAAVARRVAADLDPVLANVPGLRDAYRMYASKAAAGDLAALARPIPSEQARESLRLALIRDRHDPSPELRCAIEGWLTRCEDPEVALVLARWRGSDADRAFVEQAAAEADGWFRVWAAETLPVDLRNGATLRETLQKRIGPTCDPAPDTVRDARLALALATGVPEADLPHIHFWLALHQGPMEVARFVAANPAFVTQLGANTLYDLGVEWLPSWESRFPEDFFVGLQVTAADPSVVGILGAVAAAYGNHRASRFAYSLLPAASPKYPRKSFDDTPPPCTKATRDRFEAVLNAGPGVKAAAVDALRRHLPTATDDDFAVGVNEFLLSKVSGRWDPIQLISGVCLAGVSLQWTMRDRLSAYIDVFEAVAGSVAVRCDSGEGRREDDPVGVRRFAWLLARLSDVAATGRLRV